MRSGPNYFLRIEGALLAVFGILFYTFAGDSWMLFAILSLAPDIGMLGYLVNPRVGSWVYNIMHTEAIPLLLVLFTFTGIYTLPVALIWLAHIGVDRACGLGLKYPTAFKETHLQKV